MENHALTVLRVELNKINEKKPNTSAQEFHLLLQQEKEVKEVIKFLEKYH